MAYKEAVREKITGEADGLDRRRELWAKIAQAYEQGGADTIKSMLIESGDSISKEFSELLNQLRKKL